MKKLAVIIAAASFALMAPIAVLAADHGHGSMKHGDHSKHGAAAHEEVVNGVKATFKVMSMAEHMKAMKMEMPKGIPHRCRVQGRQDRQGDHRG